MTAAQPKNPLHGLTLERIVTDLVARFGWAGLGRVDWPVAAQLTETAGIWVWVETVMPDTG